MPAPTYGSSYMEVAAPLVGNPANAAEATPNLDANFNAAWNSIQEQCPLSEDGDYAFKIWSANLAYRYAMASTTFTPTITNISPTTGVHSASPLTITITGTKYDASAVPLWNGVAMVSTSQSLTSMVFVTSAPTAGTYTVQVRNSDGATSASTNYTAT